MTFSLSAPVLLILSEQQRQDGWIQSLIIWNVFKQYFTHVQSKQKGAGNKVISEDKRGKCFQNNHLLILINRKPLRNQTKMADRKSKGKTKTQIWVYNWFVCPCISPGCVSCLFACALPGWRRHVWALCGSCQGCRWACICTWWGWEGLCSADCTLQDGGKRKNEKYHCETNIQLDQGLVFTTWSWDKYCVEMAGGGQSCITLCVSSGDSRVAELWFRRRWRLSVTWLALHHLQAGLRLERRQKTDKNQR